VLTQNDHNSASPQDSGGWVLAAYVGGAHTVDSLMNLVMGSFLTPP
jgi:hypothetical protein